MTDRTVAPHGTWKSPITSDLIVTESIGLSEINLDGADTYWLESRPSEGGRSVIVRRTPDGRTTDLTTSPFNARTRVHEYGGGAYCVHDGTVYSSNFDDNRLYRVVPGSPPEPITPEAALRYADFTFDARRNQLIGVREDHSMAHREAINTIAAVSVSGDGRQTVLVEGNDFYAFPRLNPEGTHLAWTTWNHPNMPWDSTELWMAEISVDGTLTDLDRIAGGATESIFQPEWSPDGTLYFVSDRSGWWNIYRWRAGKTESVTQMEAEFGQPQWIFGMPTYGFAGAETIVAAYDQDGFSHLAMVDTKRLSLTELPTPYTYLSDLRATDGWAVFTAASSTQPESIVQLHLADGRLEVLRRSTNVPVDEGYISQPQAIEFPTEGDLTAHAFYYPPRNKDFEAPSGEPPPLIVESHGGPTGATDPALRLSKQFWTSRGFAVVDVNYGGSTGYGREYRERLKGKWGIVDVDDTLNAARYLVERGLADENRLMIHGGSAGGYTTLSVLAFRDLFKAGASYFGVGDLEALATDTHKFESRYLDGMVGPYPAARDVYRERSALYHTDRLSRPVILFQGLDDKVVPPNQAEQFVQALDRKGVPYAYVAYEGEGHGFRRAENIKRTLDAELYFYSRILGFEPADKIEPVEIANLT